MNSRALIVGGSGGIGSETALALSKAGYDVICTYYSTPPEQIQNLNTADNIQFIKMDVADQDSVANSMKSILEEGPVDVIVWSVTSSIRNRPLMVMKPEDIEIHYAIQLKGFFFLFEQLKPQITARKRTRFILILSEYVIGKPPKSVAHYVASKYALLGLAKSMATELVSYGTTVNMISPGMVDTGLLDNLPPKLIEITAESNPMKRIAKPMDVSGLVLYLAGESADYLNGVNIAVNGGGVIA